MFQPKEEKAKLEKIAFEEKKKPRGGCVDQRLKWFIQGRMLKREYLSSF